MDTSTHDDPCRHQTNNTDAAVPVITAVIENRAKEVGLAIFRGDEVTLRLLQYVGETKPVIAIHVLSHPDFKYAQRFSGLCLGGACAETSRTYTTTLSLLGIYDASVLLTVASSQEVLSRGINQATKEYHQIPMARVRLTPCRGSF
jgi:hypothetical protein